MVAGEHVQMRLEKENNTILIYDEKTLKYSSKETCKCLYFVFLVTYSLAVLVLVTVYTNSVITEQMENL